MRTARSQLESRVECVGNGIRRSHVGLKSRLPSHGANCLPSANADVSRFGSFRPSFSDGDLITRRETFDHHSPVVLGDSTLLVHKPT